MGDMGYVSDTDSDPDYDYDSSFISDVESDAESLALELDELWERLDDFYWLWREFVSGLDDYFDHDLVIWPVEESWDTEYDIFE